MNRIFLLSFQFAPFSDVGANRWNNLVHHFSRAGQKIIVLSVDWGADKDFYTKNFPGVDVKVLRSGTLHRLKQRKFSVKVLNIAKNLLFRFFLDKFFSPDYACRWSQFVLKELANNNPSEGDVIIATGAPFSVNVIGAQVKAKFKEIKLVQDVRDVWVDNPYIGHRYLSRNEKFALEKADLVVTVSDYLSDLYKEKYDLMNVITIENGFSPDKFYTVLRPPSSKRIRIIHTGNVTNGRDVPLLSLLRFLKLKPDLAAKVEITLLGTVSRKLVLCIHKDFGDLIKSGIVILRDKVEQTRVREIVSENHAVLLLNSPDLSYALSTKVYEYAAMEMPILSLNYGGAIQDFLNRHSWGLGINLGCPDAYLRLEKFLNGFCEASYDFSDKKTYCFENQAQQYLEAIKKL